MQYVQRTDRKIVGYEETEYDQNRRNSRDQGKKKFSRTMALILGVVLTLELMIMGAMLFHIDFHSADRIAMVFAFAVLYFGVVAGLTDK